MAAPTTLVPPSAAELPLGFLEPILADWRVPTAIAIAYALGVTIFNPTPAQAAANRKAGVGSGAFLKFLVVAHNVVLCVFSAAVFLGAAPAYIGRIVNNPTVESYCDKSGTFWAQALAYYTWVFYLSKYYEIFDTVILLVKGKRSSLLQTYHHIGAILCMHVNYYTQSTPVTVFVIFNSFIHTLMYFYYALTTVGIHPPGKKYLTRMQISQFVVGMSIALSFLGVENLYPGQCLKSDANKFAIYFNVAYLIPLTYLFVDFMWKTYGRRSALPTKAKKE
ncbi:hypothetical protein AMAG_15456 [Allomyces macrogynus ATCC 38327]|uniref:Elongation of fatty acids protein n=1 Tax=Allomyces macrogynus (strain ATCC 38327) TaxID=578462 RepID=A0A0L0T7M6_ALLM3|nr:hypothetical protein AMAG_15456 [Allomyces macrogynus ATCC 38327]|eukprot:KNE70701.1 hypothetical protein AMAG_15456 [Allomyces macrogynus ATCC 38327]